MDAQEKYLEALNIEKTGGSREKIVALLSVSADEGFADSQYALGTLYLHGKYVDRDVPIAIDYLRRAAAQMHPDALFDLGVALEKGEEGAPSPEEAFRHYFLAAVSGDRGSIYELARCYYYGIGTPNDRKAYNILMQASDHFNGVNYGAKDK